MGLGFLMEAEYLLPLTVLFLLISISALGFRAKHRRGYAPLALGILSSAGVILGKYVLDSDLVMYVGVVLLVAASLWNAWPRKILVKSSCSTGVPSGAASETPGTRKSNKEALK